MNQILDFGENDRNEEKVVTEQNVEQKKQKLWKIIIKNLKQIINHL